MSTSSSSFNFGGDERRTFRNSYATQTGAPVEAGGSLQIKGHASVFDLPSVEMKSHAGTFTEYIARGAFDQVLRSTPDVLLTWDHNTALVLARTGAGSLELRADARGLRYFAKMSDTSYARDLQALMRDGVVAQSSFLFTVAPGGENWRINPATGGVERTITNIGQLYDVCVCASGAYPDTDSMLARTALDYALERGFLSEDPALQLRKAKARARLATNV
jgi:HK97 family phage prohead protease